MLRKLQYICLVGSIGLIGADRIDLFAGHGPFVLTPFLILAPLVLLISLLQMGFRGTFRLTITPPIRRQATFLTASILLLLFSLVSIPFGLDPERGVVAFGDLALVFILGYCISVWIVAEPEQERLILRSITFGLLAYVVFCVAECIAWTHGVVLDQGQTASWMESTLAPATLLWAPRLSGTTVDANRSGFILVMYLALLDKFVAKSRYTVILRYAIAFLIVLTLSRSAIICWFVYSLFSRTFWKRVASRRGVVWLAGIAIISSLVCVVYQDKLLALAEAWEISDVVSSRMSTEEGSSGEDHIMLIRRGLATWSTSTHTMITGIGFAAAPKVLGDVFGNDKHGNFHCLYVTILAELGLPAFVILMFLLGYPIIGRKGTVSCMLAIMIFNLTYQTHMEPVFWVVLALLWSYERRDQPNVWSLALANSSSPA